MDKYLVAADPTTDFLRTAAIRDQAMNLQVKNSDTAEFQRAADGRTRSPPLKSIAAGNVVHVWHNNVKHAIKGWVGPGLAVAINATQRSVRVSTRGVLVKCNMERVRPATEKEWIVAEIVRFLSSDATASLERQCQHGCVDVAGEEGPLPEEENQATREDSEI